MIVDLTVILIFFISLWIGWSLRISIDWLRMLWIILFAILISITFPYFISFVKNSSTNFPITYYYIFGIVLAGMIFLGFYLLLKTNRSPSSGIRRLAGSLVLAFVSTYSLLIVLVSMAEYGLIDVSNSRVLTLLPSWILSPVN